MTFRFVGRPPASRFMRFILPVPATTVICSLSPLQDINLRSMYKRIVKKQVSDGPRLKPGQFCLMGRQSRSKGREWDRNGMSMGRQWDARMLREH